ncbi:ubiquitin carboxyl-terminal hydrolase, partial [Cardiosporidium cionae]
MTPVKMLTEGKPPSLTMADPPEELSPEEENSFNEEEDANDTCRLADLLFSYNLRTDFVPHAGEAANDRPFSPYGLGELKKGIWKKGKNKLHHFIGPNPRENRKCSPYVGLKNLGATCYMNTYLQCLFMNLDFRRALLDVYQYMMRPCTTTTSSSTHTFLPVKERASMTTQAEKKDRSEVSPAFSQPSLLSPTLSLPLCPQKDASEQQFETQGESLHERMGSADKEGLLSHKDIKREIHGSLKSQESLKRGVASTPDILKELVNCFGLMQEGQSASIDPRRLAEHLSNDLHNPEDATEFCYHLLNTLEEQLGGSSSQMNFIPSIFQGHTRQVLQCGMCHHVGGREEAFYQLSCHAKTVHDVSDDEGSLNGMADRKFKEKENRTGDGPSSGVDRRSHSRSKSSKYDGNSKNKREKWKLEDILKDYFGTERLAGEYRYACPVCNEKQDGTKRVALTSLPP